MTRHPYRSISLENECKIELRHLFARARFHRARHRFGPTQRKKFLIACLRIMYNAKSKSIFFLPFVGRRACVLRLRAPVSVSECVKD